MIQLLHFILQTDFDTDEKNRIRRNLETFKPWVVSKMNHANGFFERVMNYPEPLPRRIKKDLKMFPWDSLEHGLDKIISSKYVSVYASSLCIAYNFQRLGS
jgi:hypothetical protein